jgi:quinoprotein glucose dehydrogenase
VAQRQTLETNPIIVNGVLYGYATGQKVFAVNAATGKEIWKFEPGTTTGRGGNNRGLSYWSSGANQRIFAPVQRYVYALDQDRQAGAGIWTGRADRR